MTLTDAGRLDIVTPVGGFQDDRPVAWQEVDGQRVAVAADYALAAPSEDSQAYGFRLGSYDPARPLLLDPTVIVYAGYIGGSGDEGVWGSIGGIAVDGSGAAYVTGTTTSTEVSFPVVVGPDTTHNGGSDGTDVYVAKVAADGTGLIYAGYIGGSNVDHGYGIAVDRWGAAYVTGYTGSNQASFPVKDGPDTTYNGRQDAFVAKVAAGGTALVYAGYIGGSSFDYGHGIAVDGWGAAYVTGYTRSTEASFPVKDGPDTSINGGLDAFVAKVAADGTALVYAGYIGGSNEDRGHGIAVDGSGAAYVTGYTYSDEASFPVKDGPDTSFNGTYDAFVAKVAADGMALVYAGYIGGSELDEGNGIAVDETGAAYVTGYTRSDEVSFPVKDGPDTTYNGGLDAFVAKVAADGTALVYAGYIGGSSFDHGYGIAVDEAGAAYVTGDTNSTEATFPVQGGPDLIYNGDLADAFVAKVAADGTALIFAGYIGGSSQDGGLGIAVDGSGRHLYVTGYTNSTEASFPVKDGPDTSFNGTYDAFVAKISPNQPPDCSQTYPSQYLLWPPNHQFVPINILGVTDPDGDAVTVTINTIHQDEAVNAKGSGNTAPDGQVVDSTALVRAERVGDPKAPGNGRVYHIGFTAADAEGASCTGEVLVGVPHDQGGYATPIDDGPNYDSTQL